MNKKDIENFLSSNPTEKEKQAVWDKHIKETGYKDGMFMCFCGCYQFGFGKAVNGEFYLEGHAPKVSKMQEVKHEPEEDSVLVKVISNFILLVLASLAIYAALSTQAILEKLFR